MPKERLSIQDVSIFDTKGVTPKYVINSNTIVLNQKCIRDGIIDWSFARFISDEQNIPEDKYVRVGDLLINSTGTGTAGRSSYVDVLPAHKRVVIDSHMLIVRFDDGSLSQFFSYALYSHESLIKTLLIGSSGQGELDKLSVFNIKFPYARDTAPVFQKILTAINQKIELNNKINIELETIARTLYSQWFVQFDFPDEAQRPYKTAGGAMVYSKELKREIPAGWEAKPIAKLMGRPKNGDWGKGSQTAGYQRVYCVRGADIAALNNSTTLNPPVRYISSSHVDRLLSADDLVVEISGGSPTQSTGRMAYIGKGTVDRFSNSLVCSNFCKAITPIKSEYSSVLKHYWDSLFQAGVFFNYEGKTSGIKNLLFDQLTRDLYLAMPMEDTILKEYHEIFSESNAAIQNNLSQNQRLAEIRDWLLPILMSGETKVG